MALDKLKSSALDTNIDVAGTLTSGAIAASGNISTTSNTISITNSSYPQLQINGSTKNWSLFADAGGPLYLKNTTDNSNSVLIHPTGGVSFNGDTAAANVLDDYEEGTWAPTISSGGTITGGGGFYRKIGSVVIAYCSYSVATLSGSGLFTIGNLPFTSSTNFGSQGAVRNQGINGGGGNVIVVEPLGGTNTVRFHYPSSTAAQLTVQIADVTVGDFNAWTLIYDI